jgi:hypothetical protein
MVFMHKVGDVFVSQKSAHLGVIDEIVPNDNGTYRVRFVDGRWTTVS